MTSCVSKIWPTQDHFISLGNTVSTISCVIPAFSLKVQPVLCHLFPDPVPQISPVNIWRGPSVYQSLPGPGIQLGMTEPKGQSSNYVCRWRGYGEHTRGVPTPELGRAGKTSWRQWSLSWNRKTSEWSRQRGHRKVFQTVSFRKQEESGFWTYW